MMMGSESGVPGVVETKRLSGRCVGVKGAVELKGSGGARVGVEGVEGVSDSLPSARSVLVERTARERGVFARTRRGREGESVSADIVRAVEEFGSSCPGVAKEGREVALEN
jgi:hypothetical protein